MSKRQKNAVQGHGRASPRHPVCHRCGGRKFSQSRGFHSFWRTLVFLFLCLFLLLPGLIYFATRHELFTNCRQCGAEWLPKSGGG